MGNSEKLDCNSDTITLYTAQPDFLVNRLWEDGCHYAKLAAIAEKYEDSWEVFRQAYSWYVTQAQQIVSRPPQAESAIWTFLQEKYLDRHPGYTVLQLEVPIQQAVFFRMRDWNRILNLRYIGDSEEEEAQFFQRLDAFKIAYEGDIYTTPYYPQLRRELINSWKRLFRYDASIKEGARPEIPDLQAGLWYLDKDWVRW